MITYRTASPDGWRYSTSYRCRRERHSRTTRAAWTVQRWTGQHGWVYHATCDTYAQCREVA